MEFAHPSQSIAVAPSSVYQPPVNGDIDRNPMATYANPPPTTNYPSSSEPPAIHRTRSEFLSLRSRGPDAGYSTAASDPARSRAMSTSLLHSAAPPPRSGNSKASLSLYASPTFVTPTETMRTPPLPDLPDPNTYPTPSPHYQTRAPSRYNGVTPPISLFSEGSSSASTRSSLAYNSVYMRDGGRDSSITDDSIHRRGPIPSHYTADTSFSSHDGEPSMGDYDHGEVGVATTSDEVVHLAHSASMSSFTSTASRARPMQPASDSSRWSDVSYGRGMSMGDLRQGNSAQDWDPVQEEDTDEEDLFVDTELEDDEFEDENDRTAAVMVAEEGLGLIVHGESQEVDRLVVRPGTTHLLLSGSATPNQMPSFLTSVLPGITNTLLALDISCNILPALPPILASCEVLEELNIAANPLRVLPNWLSQLTTLRVLIADNTAITALPQSLHSLSSLHTISIRKNRLYSLPAWLCLLPALETLLLDGNPFIEPWKALVAPVLERSRLAAPAPPSTLPPGSAALSIPNSMADQVPVSAPFPLTPNPELEPQSNNNETSLRRSFSNPTRRAPERPAVESMYAAPPGSRPSSSKGPSAPQLSRPPSPRSRAGSTTLSQLTVPPPRSVPIKDEVPAPARAALVGSYLSALDSTLPDAPAPKQKSSSKTSSAGSVRAGMRRMKSADELSRFGTSQAAPPPTSPPSAMYDGAEELPTRFESLPKRGGGPGGAVERTRPPLTVFADSRSPPRRDQMMTADSRPNSIVSRPASRVIPDPMSPDGEDGQKSQKWGFLKKMSMGRMRSTTSPREQQAGNTAAVRQGVVRAHTVGSRGSAAYPAISPPGGMRPDTIHSSSAPSVPQITEDGMALPPHPMNLSHLPPALPTIAAPLLEEEEFAGEDAPALPPKSEIQKKQSREALTHLTVASTDSRSPSPAISAGGGGGLLMPQANSRAQKRRSFLPLSTPSTASGFDSPMPTPDSFAREPAPTSPHFTDDSNRVSYGDDSQYLTIDAEREAQEQEAHRQREHYKRGLRSIMAYLRDLSDLSGPLGAGDNISTPTSPASGSKRRPTLNSDSRMHSDSGSGSGTGSGMGGGLHKKPSMISLSGAAMSVATSESSGSANVEERKYKEDTKKRVHVVNEIVKTERTYVTQLKELIDIFVIPSAAPAQGTFGTTKESVIPTVERRVVFNGVEPLFKFHKDTLLPSLERALAPLQGVPDDQLPDISASVASQIAMAFVSHAAFMKMYNTYINNFDNCIARIQSWARKPEQGGSATPGAGAANVIGMGLSMSVVAGVAPAPAGNIAPLTPAQRKRVKHFKKKAEKDPRVSQINMEGYLLLPVQRVPRYKLFLEDLVKCTPPKNSAFEDPLEVALNVIAGLATGMNEGKRETESRQKLLHWQKRIKGRFPSPLVQPHRRLVMDGRLTLSRVVRKSQAFAEIYKADREKTIVQVDCLTTEVTPRPLVGLLCNDLLVLCKDPSHGGDPNTYYDLWAVLRMQTVPQPASVVHGSTLRVVDNKAVLYFDAASTSEALTWCRAINTHIPASR
ncbi:hypothetical protein DL93DRAFT_2070483 [Clavulina sp. PMI_390]|nr:hypothetical protein DL93DRAFT_2070483 [Clavulina sp. PMI_390]